MHFNNPIPRAPVPKFVESSSQRSPRDTDSTGRLWQKASKVSAQTAQDTNALHMLERKVEQLRRRIIGSVATIQEDTAAVGGLFQTQITALYGSENASVDYFQVAKYDGSNVSNTKLYCAKSIPSQMTDSYLGEFIYTYTDDNNRVSNRVSDSNLESQVMTQPFSVGDTVYVSPVDHTGVYVANFDNGNIVGFSNVEIKYIEVNTEREWTKPPDA